MCFRRAPRSSCAACSPPSGTRPSGISAPERINPAHDHCVPYFAPPAVLRRGLPHGLCRLAGAVLAAAVVLYGPAVFAAAEGLAHRGDQRSARRRPLYRRRQDRPLQGTPPRDRAARLRTPSARGESNKARGPNGRSRSWRKRERAPCRSLSPLCLRRAACREGSSCSWDPRTRSAARREADRLHHACIRSGARSSERCGAT